MTEPSKYLIEGKLCTESEYNQWSLQQQLREDREDVAIQREYLNDLLEAEKEGFRLIRKLGADYQRYREFLTRHPDLEQRINEEGAADLQIYLKLRDNLQQAYAAPRCSRIRANGSACRAPRLRGGTLCYAHARMADVAAPPKPGEPLKLPRLEDGNGVQLAIMQVLDAMGQGRLSDMQTARYLYGLQLASTNLAHVDFRPDHIREEEDPFVENHEIPGLAYETDEFPEDEDLSPSRADLEPQYTAEGDLFPPPKTRTDDVPDFTRDPDFRRRTLDARNRFATEQLFNSHRPIPDVKIISPDGTLRPLYEPASKSVAEAQTIPADGSVDAPTAPAASAHNSVGPDVAPDLKKPPQSVSLQDRHEDRHEQSNSDQDDDDLGPGVCLEDGFGPIKKW